MNTGKDRRRLWTLLAIAATVNTVSGCGGWKTDGSRWLSPDKVVKSPKGPAPVRAIDRNIGVADQDQERVAGSTLPKAEDFEYSAQDYRIGPGDILDISVLDLFNDGMETVVRRQVTESGYIDLPLLEERVLAEDKTQEQLKDAIINEYEPDILVNPTVAISILAQRQNTFSILGAVTRTGQYNIVRRSMRVLEALALAGGVTQSNIQYVYVIRQRPPKLRAPAKLAKPAKVPPAKVPPAKVPPAKVPPAKVPPAKVPPAKVPPAKVPPDGQPDGPAAPKGPAVPKGTVPKPGDGDERTMLPAPSQALMLAETDAAPPVAGPAKAKGKDPDTLGWRFDTSTGKWVKTRKGAVADRLPPGDPFKWDAGDDSEAVRIIAIDLKRLSNGEPRMNIVVQDEDVIHIPPLEIGEFYVMGEVQRPGVFSLTGRKITIKMAIAAAGNFGPLAWPENAVLIRRIGVASEQMVPLNIERIFRGEQNDLYLKANDVIAVGTDIRAPFLAVLRNAFRMTYGFGFIYDRNFGATSSWETNRNSQRFSRW